MQFCRRDVQSAYMAVQATSKAGFPLEDGWTQFSVTLPMLKAVHQRHSAAAQTEWGGFSCTAGFSSFYAYVCRPGRSLKRRIPNLVTAN